MAGTPLHVHLQASVEKHGRANFCCELAVLSSVNTLAFGFPHLCKESNHFEQTIRTLRVVGEKHFMSANPQKQLDILHELL